MIRIGKPISPKTTQENVWLCNKVKVIGPAGYWNSGYWIQRTCTVELSLVCGKKTDYHVLEVNEDLGNDLEDLGEDLEAYWWEYFVNC